MQALSNSTESVDAPTYREVLRIPAMSVGTYALPAGAADPQQPHTEDEIYVILRGRGTLRAESGNAVAEPGAAMFVPAGEPHSFVDITEDLLMYVIFAPAEWSLRPEATR